MTLNRFPLQPRTTVVIPLYRSAPFIDGIIANIEAIPGPDVEVLISDRHCHDDTLDRLEARFSSDPRVGCHRHTDELDWVGHLNALLQVARGEYWRFLPHDDLSPPGSLEHLICVLDSDPDAILAYGPTAAIDARGRPLPKMDRPEPHPAGADDGWNLGLALEMNWRGYFSGAFKGLIRRRPVLEHGFLIRSTLDQINAERCWLFALSLLGRFLFVPESLYVKRYHENSTHAQWRRSGRHVLSTARVMSGYLRDTLGSCPTCDYGIRDLWLNARQRGRWIDDPTGGPPRYTAAPDPTGEHRGLALPVNGGGP